MSDLTTPARLVAEGVGLPAVWRDSYCGAWQNDRSRKGELDLSDPQTAFGCALKLDEWERAASGPLRGAPSWAMRTAQAGYWRERDEVLEALVARLRVIGEDAMIRRALGWEVEAGTLATLAWHGGLRCWMMKHPSIPTHDHAWPFIVERILSTGADTPVPALAGITDPNEARMAIWREVSDVG